MIQEREGRAPDPWPAAGALHGRGRFRSFSACSCSIRMYNIRPPACLLACLSNGICRRCDFVRVRQTSKQLHATIMGEVKLDLLELPPDEGHETTSSLQRAAQRFLSRSSRGAEYVANELL